MLLNPVKTLENIGQIISRNTHPVVTNRYFHLPVTLFGTDYHLNR